MYEFMRLTLTIGEMWHVAFWGFFKPEKFREFHKNCLLGMTALSAYEKVLGIEK